MMKINQKAATARWRHWLAAALVSCLLGLFFAPALAATATSSLVKRIQLRYRNISTLRAAFTQEVRSQAASLSTAARGTLYIRRPDSMRWDYHEPPQWFLVLGTKAYHYVPEDGVVYAQEVKAPEIFALFSGFDHVSRTFRITRLPDTSGVHHLELIPLEPDFPVAKINLAIASDSLLVVTVETVDGLGNRNRVHLDRIEENPELPDSIFQLQVPPGAILQKAQDLPAPP